MAHGSSQAEKTGTKVHLVEKASKASDAYYLSSIIWER